MRVTWPMTLAPGPSVASAQRVEDDPGEELGEEERRLRRHRLPGGGDLANLRDRRRPEDERAVVLARADKAPGLVEPLRVPQPALAFDVVVAHPERRLEDELLEDH